MDFSVEEAMDMIIECILSSGLIGIALFFLLNCHRYYS